MTRILPLALPLAAAALALAACAETPGQPRPTTAAAAPAPDATVREAQTALRREGFYEGPIDGLWGAGTQSAVERYQRARGLAADGRLGGETMAALRGEAPRATAGIGSTSPAAPPPRAVAINDATTVRTVQNRLKQLGYYDGAADGVWGPEMQQAVERFNRSKGLPAGELTTASLDAMGLDARRFPAGEGAAAALDRNVVRAVQRRLQRDGFYRGGVDGEWGPGTQAALERFQKARGIEPQGQLTPPTISALGLDPNNLVASANAALGGVGSSSRR
jgi:peptidoglycan hydrolase-like protein with peptidoglycan-binding domain